MDYEWALSAVASPRLATGHKTGKMIKQTFSQQPPTHFLSIHVIKPVVVVCHFSLTDFNCTRLGGAEALCEVVSPEREETVNRINDHSIPGPA